MARFLSPRELMQLLAVPVPLLDRTVPLASSDTDPDPGLKSFARPGAGSLLVAETILHPDLPNPALRPVFEMLSFASMGFLPTALREAYGIPWTGAHQAAHRSLCLLLRTARAGVPRRLRVAPIHEFALARSRGKLIASAA